jgi:hypothetical protein
VSRNALIQFVFCGLWLAGISARAADSAPSHAAPSVSRVVMVENLDAVTEFKPNDAAVRRMVNDGIEKFTGKSNTDEAWRSLVSTQDVVGIKVCSAAGEISGTRPSVVIAVACGLMDAGLPPQHIIIWDKNEKSLRAAGFFKLAAKLGIRCAGAQETGYDPTNFYEPGTAIIGNLVYGDLEFGQKGDGIGKKSFVTKIVSRQITKIISIAPLLNQNFIGVNGHLYSLGIGSVDNTLRFDNDGDRLAIAVPEIYALPAISDHVVLNITDALIGQYEGGGKGLLHYSSVLNQLWFSHDPVALDLLSIKELDNERTAHGEPGFKPNLAVYSNAALLQFGVNDPAKISVEKIK